MTLYTLVDPALGVVSGHHVAICSRYVELAESGFKVRVIANEKFMGEQREELERAGADVWPVLRYPIYISREESQGLSAIRSMLGMALDIRKVLRASRDGERQIAFFYPTVDWMYAKALALALGSEPASHFDHFHFPLLMSSPWDVEMKGDVPKREMEYIFAFRALNRHSSVRLLVASIEHMSHYQMLLDEAGGMLRLGLCPCFLSNWEKIEEKPERNHLLVFVGDPRVDKGFFSLPELLKRVLSVDAWRKFSVWVQHTPIPEWDDGSLQEVSRSILEISRNEPRIRYVNGLWSEGELQEAIRGAAVVFLNYDRRVFEFKSSGILWLAGFYRTPVAIPRGTWLWRESERLGCPACDIESVFSCVFTSPSESSSVSDYREMLYRPFTDWISRMVGDMPMLAS